MPAVALSGNDTFTLNNRIFADLATGTWAELTYPNESAAVKTGKNNNTIYSQNQAGLNADLTVRIIRGSADDKFLNGLFAQQSNNFAGFVLLQGQLVKKIGQGNGKIINDTYVLTGGVFTKPVEAKSNVEGDTEQSESIYRLRFALAPRAIG
jgi:hypothetical protein